jgi:hypothetical protein
MTVKFTRADMGSFEIDPLPGTLKSGGGGGDVSDVHAPPVRRANAVNGSCEAALDESSLTVSRALGLATPVGLATTSMTGDVECSGALVDVSLESQDGILVASISWKGVSGGASQ